MKKFIVIQNIPSPYRLHIFNEMWRQLQARGIDFHVYFMARGHRERPKSWLNPSIEFPHTYWKDFGFGSHHFNVAMIVHLLFHRPDYLLVGSPFDTFTGICASFLLRVKSRCCWVEGQTKTPGKMSGFIGMFKRLVLSQFPLVAVPGLDAVRYIEMHQRHTSLKMPKSIFLPNLVDETRFRSRNQWPREEICTIRASVGCEASTRLCLIPARLDVVKGIVPFINKLEKKMVNGWMIVIMGQGPLKADILQAAQDRDVSSQVRILDYVAYNDMPKYYAAADLFLLPSIHDPNPLSVPEALHSGLPIALSDRCGNVEEAVTDGVNGWRLPVMDSIAFGNALKCVFSASENELREKGRCSSTNASFWQTKERLAAFVDGML